MITKVMNSCDAGDDPKICWFCKKGRHEDCMNDIPTQARLDGPHDCTFDVVMIKCKCKH